MLSPTEVSLRAVGVPVTLCPAGPQAARLRDELMLAWARCLLPDPDAFPEPGAERIRIRVSLHEDPEQLVAARARGEVAADTLEELMDAVSPAVTVAAIEAQAGRLLMLHAAAVCDGVGRAVALVGPSGAGKTTAVRTLARELGYLTDETVGVRADRSLVAYPKPLSVLEPGSPYKRQVSPDELVVATPPEAVTLVKVLLLSRDPAGPARPELEPVPTVRALAALSPETSSLARLERPLHRLADLLHATGGLDIVRYREADDLAPVIAGLAGGGAWR